MSNNKLDKKLQQGLQARLGRISENEFELFKQRREIERELKTIETSRSNKEFKGLKAQHWALGKAMDALAKQRIAIMTVLDNPNAFDEHESSDKAELITKLKDEEADVRHKLTKLSVFLLDDDKTAKVDKGQLRLLQMQQQAMANYRRILVARIFHLETDKGENNND